MTSTLTKKDFSRGHPSPTVGREGYVHNGASHIPLGSEGSSRGSERSSFGDGEGHLPETVDIEVILPDKETKFFTVDYG